MCMKIKHFLKKMYVPCGVLCNLTCLFRYGERNFKYLKFSSE